MMQSSAHSNPVELAARPVNSSAMEVELAIPDIHCAGCINTIEKALLATRGVSSARVNLTQRRVRIRWLAAEPTPDLIAAIERSGFKAFLPEAGLMEAGDKALRTHILALAVAGFAAGNVMMLSMSVWSGADAQTQHVFHWVSAAIALPALVFSSRIFFASALQALRVGRTNMDVPICVGIVMTVFLSIFDTIQGGGQVYFDAAIMLVFLLLIGRTLETRMRAKVRSSVDDLAKLQPVSARTIAADGQHIKTIPVQEVRPGDRLLINANERIPVDCQVVSGVSSIDKSLVTGESAPVRVGNGEFLFSGCLNLEGELHVVTNEPVNNSFLARIEQQIDQAQANKGRYQQMADRVVSYYTPFVHLAALFGFLAWLWTTGDWHRAVSVGVTVLIITCPCALGLAVPIARVIASHQLLKNGVLMKDGSALERLAVASKVIFDKTGTLTSNQAQLRIDASLFGPELLATAQSLCNGAEHPYAKALARFQAQQPVLTQSTHHKHIRWQNWNEVPGDGIEAELDTAIYRLGRADWALKHPEESANDISTEYGASLLTKNGAYLATFSFEDSLHADALDCIAQLRNQRLNVEILSGDIIGPVQRIANTLHVSQLQAGAKPEDKLQRVTQHQSVQGQHILMVGDGINDSPALAAASVSMVPGTGADMTRKMADFILLNNQLTAIPQTIGLARRTRRIVAQNLALAVGYNVVALPLAMTGVVTPLIAAIAMSVSSVLVIGNSLRLSSSGAIALKWPTWHHSELSVHR